jgi:hypothetical protein
LLDKYLIPKPKTASSVAWAFGPPVKQEMMAGWGRLARLGNPHRLESLGYRLELFGIENGKQTYGQEEKT